MKSNEKGRPPPVSAADLLAPKEADDGPATGLDTAAPEPTTPTGAPNQRSQEPARP